MTPARIIDSLGGVASTAELYRRGVTRLELRAALAAVEIVRTRQGHFCRAGLSDVLFAAARVGGRATASSALASRRVWVPDDRLHVAVPSNACRLRSPSDKRVRLVVADEVCVHWNDDGRGSRLIVDPIDALSAMAACSDLDDVILSADSLLHRRPDLLRTWSESIRHLPRAVRRALVDLDGVCESGTETRFWCRMRDLVAMRRQVRIPGVGRVDFLIGERLIVEVDGAAYHTDPVAFERDRRRDAILTAMGYRVLRFSYHQVMSDWDSVELAVFAALHSA